MKKQPRKHILFLTSWYPDRVTKDNGDFIQRHAKAISLRHDVTVLYAVKDVEIKHQRFEMIERKENGLREIIVYVKESWFSPFNLIFLCWGYLIGLKHIKAFDFIHLQVCYPAGLIGVYLKNKYKKPLLLTEHWSNLHPQNFKKLPFYKKMAIKWILKKVDKVYPVSDYLGKAIQQLNPNLSYQVIPNVVDVSQFGYSSSRNHKRFKFLHLSNLVEGAKNISGMLNVARRLAKDGYEFEFHIGGNGDLRPIQHYIHLHQLEKYVHVFGRIEHEKVNALMQQFDCFILFSRYENQPCVQIESFASGLPIIASDVGGIKENFPSEFGILVENENEEELYQAMLTMMTKSDEITQAKMHQFAVDHFSNEVIAAKYDEVYQRF